MNEEEITVMSHSDCDICFGIKELHENWVWMQDVLKENFEDERTWQCEGRLVDFLLVCVMHVDDEPIPSFRIQLRRPVGAINSNLSSWHIQKMQRKFLGTNRYPKL